MYGARATGLKAQSLLSPNSTITSLWEKGGDSWAPIVVYGALALVILGGTLLPGYVLTLDMVFGPEIKLEEWLYGLDAPFSAALPFQAILKALSLVAPVWLLQKLLLFGVLFLSGLSAHRLSPAQHWSGKYFAGLIYMMNPFVYVRFLAGSLTLLLAYAITPFLVAKALAFFERPGGREAMGLALWTLGVAILDLRSLVLVLILTFILFTVQLLRRRSVPLAALKLTGWVLLAALAFFLMSLYWLPSALGADRTILGDISQGDLLVFTARNWGTGFNVLFSLATMHGFWRGGYQYIGSLLPWWPLVFAVILFLAVHGAVSRWRHPVLGSYVIGMATTAMVALILSTGISTPYFSPYFEFLFDKLFFLRGLRDSQKFVALLALAYSYLGGLGLAALLEQRDDGKREAVPPNRRRRALGFGVVALALAAPILLAWNMLWGFGGQLQPTDYPRQWYEARAFLAEQPGEHRLLVFPWHLYLDLSWTGKRTSNPAPYFFPQPVIAGENAEVGPIAGQTLKPVQNYIPFLLARKDSLAHLGELLIPLNVKYIILAREADYQNYDFLYRQQDLRLVLENSHLVIWENLAYKGLLLESKTSLASADWAQFYDKIETAKNPGASPAQDTRDTGVGTDITPSHFQRLSPVSYRGEVASPGRLLLAAPYDSQWRLGGQPARPALQGLANEFQTTEAGEAALEHRGWGGLMIRYGVSWITFIIALALAAGWRPRTPPWLAALRPPA